MKKTTIFLSLSILINIFLIGYLTGNQLLSKKRHHKKGCETEQHFDKELKVELKNKRNELFDIITATEFNEAAFDAKVVEMATVHDKIKAQMPLRIKNKILGKSQEERIQFVHKMKRRHRRHKH